MRRPASNCAWAKRMSNYSDDTFGMNCSGTVLQTTYNRIHPPSDGEDVGGNIFRRDCRLGLRWATRELPSQDAQRLRTFFKSSRTCVWLQGLSTWTLCCAYERTVAMVDQAVGLALLQCHVQRRKHQIGGHLLADGQPPRCVGSIQTYPARKPGR